MFKSGSVALRLLSGAVCIRRMSSRGAFIVFEGCDRSGKTTQCKKLVQSLNSEGIKTEMMNFPDRSTAIGKVIDDYLSRRCELEDHAVHLLFAANRWEMVPRMKEALESGTTLVVDRYSYSGVAFSAAKPALSLPWCRQPEVGLLAPDVVLYMTLSPEEAEKRSEFGDERYEQTDFQKVVLQNYRKLQEENWKVIDASKTIEKIHATIHYIAKQIISDVADKPLSVLWCRQPEVIDSVTSNGSMEPESKKTKLALDCKEDGPTTDKIS